MSSNVVALVMVGAAVVLLIVIVIGLRRRVVPRSDDGVESFQRHLGALSPEARRHSIDRVSNPRQGPNKTKGDA